MQIVLFHTHTTFSQVSQSKSQTNSNLPNFFFMKVNCILQNLPFSKIRNPKSLLTRKITTFKHVKTLTTSQVKQIQGKTTVQSQARIAVSGTQGKLYHRRIDVSTGYN